ncbi:hypothetical protein AAVH_35187 [Aphelenchoides avenae]|nr:hypothetical protein AAVH_35187 [Aphelenchus avenae]
MQCHRLRIVEAQHSFTLGVVENLEKLLAVKYAELSSTRDELSGAHRRRKVPKDRDALKERYRVLAQHASDLKTQLDKANSNNAALCGEKEAMKLQLQKLEDRLKDTEMTFAGLRFALDAKDDEIEGQRRIVEILRAQYHALVRNDAAGDARSDPNATLSTLSYKFNGFFDSLQHALAERRRAEDSGVSNVSVGPLPIVEPAVRANTAMKRTSVSQGDNVVDEKPGKQARAEPAVQ